MPRTRFTAGPKKPWGIAERLPRWYPRRGNRTPGGPDRRRKRTLPWLRATVARARQRHRAHHTIDARGAIVNRVPRPSRQAAADSSFTNSYVFSSPWAKLRRTSFRRRISSRLITSAPGKPHPNAAGVWPPIAWFVRCML